MVLTKTAALIRSALPRIMGVTIAQAPPRRLNLSCLLINIFWLGDSFLVRLHHAQIGLSMPAATTRRFVRRCGQRFQLRNLHTEFIRPFHEMLPGERARPLSGELVEKRHGI